MNFSKLHKSMMLLVAAAHLTASVNAMENPGYIEQAKNAIKYSISGAASVLARDTARAVNAINETATKYALVTKIALVAGAKFIYRGAQENPKTTVAAAIVLPIAGVAVYKLCKVLYPSVKSLFKKHPINENA